MSQLKVFSAILLIAILIKCGHSRKKQDPGFRPGYKTLYVPEEFALLEISCLSDLQNFNHLSDLSEFIATIKKFNLGDNMKRLPAVNQRNKKIYHCLLESIAFMDLEEILVYSERDVCNPEHIRLMERFHYRYVSPYENQRIRFKPMVRDLFKMYALQVSAICKKNLIMNIENKAKELITIEDYQLLLPWKYENPPNTNTDANGSCPLQTKEKQNDFVNLIKIIGEFETKLDDFDDIMLMSSIKDTKSFASPRPIDLSENENTKITISARTNDALNKMVDACQNKFKPIYQGTIISVLRLSRMGYSFKGAMLRREYAELQTSELVRKWYTITQLCEAFDQIELERDHHNVEQQTDGRYNIVFTIGIKEQDPLKKQVIRDEKLHNIVFEDNRFENDFWIRQEIEFRDALLERSKERYITVSTIKLMKKTWQLFGLYLKNRLFTIRTKTSRHYDNPQQYVIDTINRGIEENKKSVDVVKALRLSITDSQGVGVVTQLFSTIISLITASIVSVIYCFTTKLHDLYRSTVGAII